MFNRGAVFQGGDNNVAQNTQHGAENEFPGIVQVNPTNGGPGNAGAITQVGTTAKSAANNFAGILQGGGSNLGVINQTAQDHGDAVIAQGGSGNVAFTTQTQNPAYDSPTIESFNMGHHDVAGTVQIGTGNLGVNSQTSSTESSVFIAQGGTGNQAANTYVGGTGHLGVITQVGDSNIGGNTSTNGGHLNDGNFLSIGQFGGSNVASNSSVNGFSDIAGIVQVGDSNAASNTQAGLDDHGSLDGSFNGSPLADTDDLALIAQLGNNNYATNSQTAQGHNASNVAAIAQVATSTPPATCRPVRRPTRTARRPRASTTMRASSSSASARLRASRTSL